MGNIRSLRKEWDDFGADFERDSKSVEEWAMAEMTGAEEVLRSMPLGQIQRFISCTEQIATEHTRRAQSALDLKKSLVESLEEAASPKSPGDRIKQKLADLQDRAATFSSVE